MTWSADTEFLDSLRLRLTSRQSELQDELAVVTAGLEALGGAGDPTPPSPPPAPRQRRRASREAADVDSTLKAKIFDWASDGRGAFTCGECAKALGQPGRQVYRSLLELEGTGALLGERGEGKQTHWRAPAGTWLPQPWTHIEHVGEGGDYRKSDPDGPLDESVEAALAPRSRSVGFPGWPLPGATKGS